MGRDEQIEEREVLSSIFPDEINDISETEYRISIKLDLPEDDENEPPVMVLSVRYPEEYPDKPPILDLSAPQNATPHPYFSVANEKDELLASLEPTIEENLGMAMIFTLVSALKEAAEQRIAERRDAAAREHEEALLAAEREENKKFHGTPVTRETFLRWREGFLREMEEARQREEEQRAAELKKARVKEPVKLTGRQLWERGLAGKGGADEEEDDEEEDVPTEAVEKLTVGGS
ncbi:hypothetical protein VTK73DRAFT_10193 [Phialemonium thermophilum]|uniref:RWD domain-containing protein n=1 Tax=Phialemonium thermophilum TaxID=223376 RepID=A0ABR3XH50_9PEZI